MIRPDDARLAMQQRLQGALERVQLVNDLPADACLTCGGTGWTYDFELGGLDRCPDCQCETCGGLGFVRYELPPDHPQFGELLPCPANCAAIQQLREQQRGAIRKYSALPPEYSGLTFETFDRLPELARQGKTMARGFAEAWAQSIPSGGWLEHHGELRNWLVLYGPHGRGKTGLAAAVVNRLTDSTMQSLYIRLQDFFEAVQKRYTKRSEGYDDDFGRDSAEDVIDAAKTAPVLIIDEADVPDLSQNKLAIAEKIFRYRHGQQLPTLLTTNLTPNAFEARWGTTIASVVFQRTHWVLMDGPSLRPAAAEWGDDDVQD